MNVMERNIKALHDGMNQNRKMINDLKTEVSQLNNQIIMLKNELNRLSATNNALLMSVKGRGSTSGE